jgi:hypothetical protein
MSTVYILLATMIGIGTLIAVTTNLALFAGLILITCVLLGIGLYLLDKETL